MKFILSILVAGFLFGCASPGGIGVLYNKKGVVKYIFEKSPAEKAGIEKEDIILNTKELRGPIGSICKVKWQRGAVLYTKEIERVDVNTFKIKQEDYGSWE